MASLKRGISDVETGKEDHIELPPASKRRLNGPSISLPLPSFSTPSRPPPFQQPYQLKTFSYVSEPSKSDPSTHVRALEWSNASMKYYVQPPKGANLAYGYERWIKRPEERGRLDGLLEACTKYECEGERRRADVITWRGVITKILTAPYEDRDGWELNVMYVDGTLYFEEHSSEEKLQEKSSISGKQRLMTYYGYAFESYCTSDVPSNHPSTSSNRERNGWGGDVDTNVQWCSIIKTKLGDSRIIIGGEVDCVRDRYTGQPDTFMELKTSISIRPGNTIDEARFEKKLLKFYFQSFLLGVPEILVGFRSPSGYIQTIQSFRTMDLPRMVRGKPGAWDPAVCLSWCDQAFDFIKRHIQDVAGTSNKDNGEAKQPGEESGMVSRATFKPGVGLSVRLLDNIEVEDVMGGEDRVGFLPRWYWEHVKGKEDPVSSKDAPTKRGVSSTGDGTSQKWAV
ncbi:hypothetical protein M422DRAFT_213508 [Sphaerobolus stellatus SS14]|uniref:Decapping nuclease n=1 Tax=Sphaerobolus stellatus (strain SS14) TaxID=990650 RepID=A0A0C9UV69_SPHS4|nr:hypothetical protein M422DRAFT_213508 [Sphaerobolus stellatus SS14]